MMHGFKVMRFWNHDIFQQTPSVLEVIMAALNNNDSPSPQPSSREGHYHTPQIPCAEEGADQSEITKLS